MISAQMKEVQGIHGLLTAEWTKSPRDLEKVGSLLSKLKVALTGLTFLPAAIDAQVSSVVGAVCVCLCVSLCVCVCLSVCLSTNSS